MPSSIGLSRPKKTVIDVRRDQLDCEGICLQNRWKNQGL
jgi:hypothetical protein